MNLDSTDYTFSLPILFYILFCTFGLFYLLIKRTEVKLKKYFLLVFCVSFFVYSGLGASILEDNGRYLFYYSIYTIVLVFSLYLFRNKSLNFKMDDNLISSFFERRSDLFILIYTSLMLLLLIFPENKLYTLISPPSIDISGVMGNVTREESQDLFTSLVITIKNIVFPFYFLSLTKYAKKPLYLFIIILVPLYISFCRDGYIARSVFGLYFLFYMGILYYFNVNLRKLILTSTVVTFLSSITFLAAFTSIRMGESVNLSLAESINALFLVEGTFPSWFVEVYNNSLHSRTYIVDYILWIVTQPFPGFMKSWLVDFYLNISIAKVLLGIEADEIVSFVPLAGLISESVFVFGNKLFFIHAIILGYILNLFSNFLLSKESFKLLMIYAIVFTCMGIGRAGTAGSDSYSLIIKTIIFLPLILHLFHIKIKP
jgi:hypothetical protein